MFCKSATCWTHADGPRRPRFGFTPLRPTEGRERSISTPPRGSHKPPVVRRFKGLQYVLTETTSRLHTTRQLLNYVRLQVCWLAARWGGHNHRHNPLRSNLSLGGQLQGKHMPVQAFDRSCISRQVYHDRIEKRVWPLYEIPAAHRSKTGDRFRKQVVVC